MPTSEETLSFSFRRPFIVLTVLLAIYVAYVFIQYGQLNDLNQRELANAAAELNSSIENALVTVTNARDQSRAPQANESRECLFDKDQPYLEFFPDCKRAADAQFLQTPDSGMEKPTGLAIAKKGTVEIRFRADVLLRELSFPESFRLLLLVDDKGLVLYQDEPARRSWRHWLRWGEQRFTDSAADKSGGMRIQNLAEALPEGKDAEWKKLRSTSARSTLTLGGDWYQVYSQPVTLAGGYMTLVGAVPTGQLVQQALAVDTHFFAMLVFLLLLGVSGIPFVKLIALDKHERFRLRDAYLLYLSTGALLALLTFVAVGVDAYLRWRAVADKGFISLASGIKDSFQREVGALRDQLVDYDRKVSALPPRDCSTWTPTINWYTTEAAHSEFNLPLPGNGRNIQLETVAWVSPGGKQVWKVTADKSTSKLSVGQRSYFRATRDNYLSQINGKDEVFFVTPDRSISDGKFKTFVSVPSEVKAGFCSDSKEDGHYTAVAVAKLLSLDRMPLPAGYGFVVINREGRVLYHSDARLSLREDFFSEIRDGSTLRSLAYAGRSETSILRSAYRERPHAFLIEPLGIQLQSGDKTETLSLVVFRDLSVEITTVSHALVIGISAAFLLLLAVVLIAIPLIPVLKRRSVWLWPHGGLMPFHQRLTLAFLGVLILGLVLSHWAVGIIFLMPFAAAAAGFGVGVSKQWHVVPREKMYSRIWQNTEIVLLSLCIVIVPSATLFRLTMNHDFGRMIATERKWIEDQKEDVGLALRAEARAEGFPEPVGTSRVEARKAYFLSDPAPYDKDNQDPATYSSLVKRLHEWLDQSLPVENDTIARYRDQEARGSYAPPGGIAGFGIFGLAGIAGIIGLLLLWIRWNTYGLFFADLESSPGKPPISPAECEAAWAGVENDDERILLIQVEREHIANPRQKRLVSDLLRRGLLKFAPDLQPSSKAFASFLRGKAQEMQKKMEESEKVAVRHSWRYVRMVLFIALGGLGLFLGATQPGWQSAVLGIASATTGLLTTLLKLQDSILQWIRKPTTSG